MLVKWLTTCRLPFDIYVIIVTISRANIKKQIIDPKFCSLTGNNTGGDLYSLIVSLQIETNWFMIAFFIYLYIYIYIYIYILIFYWVVVVELIQIFYLSLASHLFWVPSASSGVILVRIFMVLMAKVYLTTWLY